MAKTMVVGLFTLAIVAGAIGVTTTGRADTVSCSTEGEHYLCQGTAFEYILSEPTTPTPPVGLVVIDLGGPGFDLKAETSSLLEALRVLWPSARIALLIEPWQREPIPAGCSTQVSLYVDQVRSDKGPARIAANCFPQRWSPKSLTEAYNSILSKESSAEPTLLVGISFGAHRLSSVLDRLDVDNNVSALIDSPPDLSASTARAHFERRSSGVEAAIDQVTDAKFENLILQATNPKVDQPPGIGRSTFLSRHDPAAALLLLGQDALRNGPYLSELANDSDEARLSNLADPSLVRAADNFFRRRTGSEYDPSWLGYFVEFCPLFAEWDHPSFDDDPLVALLLDIHTICKNSNWHREPATTPKELKLDACIVERSFDPNGPIDKSRWPDSSRLKSSVVVGGHRPLTGYFERGLVDELSAHNICDALTSIHTP